VYNNNGNLLVKKETSFTLKTDIEENTFTISRYAYVGDQLKGYNDEAFVYDEIGNPTTYRGKGASWARGRLLTAYDGHSFTYDAQGNVIALIGENGAIVARYLYDAWGNVSVVDNNGTLISDSNHIGNVNPFRYRAYYYDTETKLYFLKTRYYDPEIGRFMTIDSISCLNPNSINGLNLYIKHI